MTEKGAEEQVLAMERLRYICFFHVFSSVFDKKIERTVFPYAMTLCCYLVMCGISVAPTVE